MPTRVVLVSIDSFVPRHLRGDLVPNLWALAQAGGHAPDGGVCDLPSVTYPSHATMLSGLHIGNHGVLTGAAGSPVPGAIPGWAGELGVARPTLFDAVRAGGLRSAAVLGDQHLVDIVNATVADSCWPPDSGDPPPAGADAHGYRTDAVIQPHVLAAVRDRSSFDFVFVHYNETDTDAHHYGPDASETLARYAETDRQLGELIAALRPAWEETVLIVLSDHGIELLPEHPPFRLLDLPEVLAIAADEIDDGGTALLSLRDGVDPAEAGRVLASLDGVATSRVLVSGVIQVEAQDSVMFGRTAPAKSNRAGHGGRSTAQTLAVIGGGHPAVARIASAIKANPPHLADWAPTIAAILGVELPGADGHSLVDSGNIVSVV